MAQPARIVGRGTLTYRDLWHTPDDGGRYEIIDGEVYVSPAPSVTHQRVALKLARLLIDHVERHRLGEVFIAPIAVILEKPSGVQPDIVFVSRQRRSIVEEKGIFGIPDLVVEVLSTFTASRDRQMKRDLYARTRVPHYWLVDPRKRTLLALRLVDGVYAVEAELGLRAPVLPLPTEPAITDCANPD